MQAIDIRQFGISGLQLQELAVPEPGPDEVLVRVHAAALNYRDALIVNGQYVPDLPLPFIPLSDGAGEIVAVGKGVHQWKAGDRVVSHYPHRWLNGIAHAAHAREKAAFSMQGMLREYAVLPATAVVRTPGHLSDREAATLPIAALTAWKNLTESGLYIGQTVLLQGTGDVSLFALQFALAMGMRVIITSSSDAKLARALELGAHAAINYQTTTDWGEAARQLNDGRGVDWVLNVGGGKTLPQSLAAVGQNGVIAAIGYLAGFDAMPDITAVLMRKGARLQGSGIRTLDNFEAMNRAIAVHAMRPLIDRCFALPQAADAFRYADAGERFGKVVIAL